MPLCSKCGNYYNEGEPHLHPNTFVSNTTILVKKKPWEYGYPPMWTFFEVVKMVAEELEICFEQQKSGTGEEKG